MTKIEGGCLCGSVRYTSDAEPAAIINCYCAACRKNSGSTNSFNLAMPKDSVKVSGDTVATYVDNSGSSGKPFERHFCSKCGSHFLSSGPGYEGLEFIKSYAGKCVTRPDQAALVSVVSITATPSVNLMPSMTFGN